MIGPVSRILARYLAGALVAKGVIDAGSGAFFATDADVVGIVQIVLGGAVSLVTEGFYYLARKLGWSK